MGAGDLERLPRRAAVQRTPVPVPGEPGMFAVDATWGTIAPMTIAPGVETVGELEVIEHLRAGGPMVDTRSPESYAAGTLPGAVNVHHRTLPERLADIDRGRRTILFCNGPQCAATPRAIELLLAAGHPADRLAYYRGGIHDWVTLGLPLRGGTAG